MKSIYLDNAATTYPKPPSVVRAVVDCMRRIGGNPGRGSHRLSNAAAELVYDCRVEAAEMFGALPDRVVFTENATHALNLAIKGLSHVGEHILLDNYAHNATYRPLCALANEGTVELELYDTSGDEEATILDIEGRLRPETGMIVATHRSNICSHVLPLERIGRLCAERGIDLVVDAAQSAGQLPLDVGKMGITALCMPGHKGLYAPMGVGMLISSEKETVYRTLLEGGAGIRSLDSTMPEELPERLEAGTLPLPAIAGLLSGMRFVRQVGAEEIELHEATLTFELAERLRSLDGVTVYGESIGSTLGFGIDGRSPAEVGAALAARGICVRTGYHCAPLAHRTVGSYDEGSVRVSVSYFNTMSDIRLLADTVEGLVREKISI